MDNYYKKTFDYSAGATNESVIRKRAKAILKKLLKLNPHGLRLLDIGSGHGYFFDEACKKGLKNYSIEPSKQLFNSSIYRNTNKSYCMTFEQYINKFGNEKFDFITLIHVIEHVQDPQKLICQIMSLLSPNGILYIETPNLDSHLYHAENDNYTFLTPPDHLWIFSRFSFQKILPINLKVMFLSTYSYPEHFMGIMKALIKSLKKDPEQIAATSQIQPPRLNVDRQDNPHKPERGAFSSISFIKYLFFDKFLAKLFYCFLNFNYYGSILELFIRQRP